MGKKAKIIINKLNKKNMKRTITLNETQLMHIVEKSVERVLMNEGIGKLMRKYSIGGEKFRGNDAETIDRVKGDKTPNQIIEYSKYRLTYSSKDGYIIRIDAESGSIFASKEPGGRSYHEGQGTNISTFYKLDGGKFTNKSLGTVRELTPQNIPDEMVVTSKKLASKIASWIKRAIPDYIDYNTSILRPNTWLPA